MSWDAIVGHELAKRLLQTHLQAGCVANAYLLAGPEGVGKRRLALEMAKAINCLADANRPCDACQVCGQISRGVHPDVHLLVCSGAAEFVRIDDVRQVMGRIILKPYSARMQVVVLDGAERLTDEAANSLLKILEEPPPQARFLLTTSRLSQCLPTIVSRCQLIRCQPLPRAEIQRILIQMQNCDPRLAEAAAHLSGGSVSAGLEMTGRWAARQQLIERLAGGGLLTWFEQPLPETRQETAAWLDGVMGWLRDLAIAAVIPPHDEAGRSWLIHRQQADALSRQAQTLDVDRCVAAAFELMALRDSLDQFVSPRLVAALAREKWLGVQSRDASHFSPVGPWGEK